MRGNATSFFFSLNKRDKWNTRFKNRLTNPLLFTKLDIGAKGGKNEISVDVHYSELKKLFGDHKIWSKKVKCYKPCRDSSNYWLELLTKRAISNWADECCNYRRIKQVLKRADLRRQMFMVAQYRHPVNTCYYACIAQLVIACLHSQTSQTILTNNDKKTNSLSAWKLLSELTKLLQRHFVA